MAWLRRIEDTQLKLLDLRRRMRIRRRFGNTLKQVAEHSAAHTGAVKSAAFSPDGRRIVTASRDKTAKIWMAASPEEVEAWRKEEQPAAK